ncbi:hypothetical protein SAMN05660649_04582 [Desulfotomaculum arcticum]|uniref:Uncharacterized protein n=1 Tax=Desulfotruncus arcticus DSM 17038 TaxID=1121424 RepID=A0A1I2YT45_9FIRM|nr:DrmE family protein [Desulfotruncus arcticus]SFH28794.1 hypothetical protein SAMN05660649_04582 [Desulfotomaculum arcticum] [Desulfotruncus arcticus DSM 17038]
MLSRQLMNNFSNKCDIYFEHSLISKELLLKTYTDFIASSFSGFNRTVGVVLHTGSICFDIVSILAAALGSLLLDGSAADDIVSSLNEGAMVQYKNNRYLWGGLGRFGKDGEFIPAESVEKASHFLLIQRRSDKNLGENISKTMLPLASKNMIIPYYGNSIITDGRGLRRGKTNRTDFIAYLFDVPKSEISSIAGVSSVVVAERVTVDRIVKGLTISYGKGKSVNLLVL